MKTALKSENHSLLIHFSEDTGGFFTASSMAGRPSNGIMLNTKAVVFSCTGLAVCLYLVYSWVSAKSPLRSGTQLRHSSTWKTHDFVDIPTELHAQELTKNVKIQEDVVTVQLEGQMLKIFYRVAHASGKEKKPPVVMLHGAGSSSEIWQKLGTMQLVAAMGHMAVAVDLPGWANSKESQLNAGLHDVFLSALLEALSIKKPMLISASMSGRYALPHMMRPDPTDCAERVNSFIALAPIHTQMFTHAEYHRCEIPTLICYGTKDVGLGLTSVGNLRNMPMSEIAPMEGAGHPNYEERPADWHRLLYNFLLAVERLSPRN